MINLFTSNVPTVASPLVSGTIAIPTLRSRFVSFVLIFLRVAKNASECATDSSESKFNDSGRFGNKSDWMPDFDGHERSSLSKQDQDKFEEIDLENTVICNFDGMEIFWIDNTMELSTDESSEATKIPKTERNHIPYIFKEQLTKLSPKEIEQKPSVLDVFRSNTAKYDWLLLAGLDTFYRAQFMESFESTLTGTFDKQEFVSSESSNGDFNYVPDDLNYAFTDVDPLTRSAHPEAQRSLSIEECLADSDFSFMNKKSGALEFKSICSHLHSSSHTKKKIDTGEVEGLKEQVTREGTKITTRTHLETDERNVCAHSESNEEVFHDANSTIEASTHQKSFSSAYLIKSPTAVGLQKRKRSKRSQRKKKRHHR